MVQGVSYGSSEVSKDEGVGNHEGVQVGGDASVQAEEQECGVMVMSIFAGWETNVRLSAFFFYGKQNENNNKTKTNPALT